MKKIKIIEVKDLKSEKKNLEITNIKDTNLEPVNSFFPLPKGEKISLKKVARKS
jgi:hypothetical protein